VHGTGDREARGRSKQPAASSLALGSHERALAMAAEEAEAERDALLRCVPSIHSCLVPSPPPHTPASDVSEFCAPGQVGARGTASRRSGAA
jgi:hypothetical protein